MRSLIILSLAIGLASCGAQKEQPDVAVTRDTTVTQHQYQGPPERIQQRPINEPGKHGFEYSYSPQSVDSIFKLPAEQRPTTVEAASTYYLSMVMPPRINIPPHLLPPVDLKLVSKSDTAALYTFKSQRNPEVVEVEFRKIRNSTDSTWVVTRMLHGLDKPKM